MAQTQTNVKISVDKEKLLNTLKINRAKHAEEYEKACEGFLDVALKKLEVAREEIKDRKPLREPKGNHIYGRTWSVTLPIPMNETEEYDRVIEMIEMHVDDTIELGYGDFRHFIQDDWDWRQQAFATNSAYLST